MPIRYDKMKETRIHPHHAKGKGGGVSDYMYLCIPYALNGYFERARSTM